MTAPICPTICGSGAGAYSATKIARETFQAIPEGPPIEVDFSSVEFDVGPAIAPDLADNALVVEQDGFYQVSAWQSWLNTPDTADVAIFIAVNDVVNVSDFFFSEPITTKAGSLTVLLELSAGDRIKLLASVVNLSPGTTATIAARLSAEKRD